MCRTIRISSALHMGAAGCFGATHCLAVTPVCFSYYEDCGKPHTAVYLAPCILCRWSIELSITHVPLVRLGG
jgi:hypothetical protein